MAQTQIVQPVEPLNPATLVTVAALLATPQLPSETEASWAARASAAAGHLSRVAQQAASDQAELPPALTDRAVAMALMMASGQPLAGETPAQAKARIASQSAHLLHLAADATTPTKTEAEQFDHRVYVTTLLAVTPVVRTSKSGKGTFTKAQVSFQPNSENRKSDTATTAITKWTSPDGVVTPEPAAVALAQRCQALVGHRVRVYAAYEWGQSKEGERVKNKVLLDVVDLGFPRTEP